MSKRNRPTWTKETLETFAAAATDEASNAHISDAVDNSRTNAMPSISDETARVMCALADAKAVAEKPAVPNAVHMSRKSTHEHLGYAKPVGESRPDSIAAMVGPAQTPTPVDARDRLNAALDKKEEIFSTSNVGFHLLYIWVVAFGRQFSMSAPLAKRSPGTTVVDLDLMRSHAMQIMRDLVMNGVVVQKWWIAVLFLMVILVPGGMATNATLPQGGNAAVAVVEPARQLLVSAFEAFKEYAYVAGAWCQMLLGMIIDFAAGLNVDSQTYLSNLFYYLAVVVVFCAYSVLTLLVTFIIVWCLLLPYRLWFGFLSLLTNRLNDLNWFIFRTALVRVPDFVVNKIWHFKLYGKGIAAPSLGQAVVVKDLVAELRPVPESLVRGGKAHPVRHLTDLPRSQMSFGVYLTEASTEPILHSHGARVDVRGRQGVTMSNHQFKELRLMDRFAVTSVANPTKHANVHGFELKVVCYAPKADLVIVSLPSRVFSVLGVQSTNLVPPRKITGRFRMYVTVPVSTEYPLGWAYYYTAGRAVPGTHDIGWKHYASTIPSSSGTPLYEASSKNVCLIHVAGGPVSRTSEGEYAEYNCASNPSEMVAVLSLSKPKPETYDPLEDAMERAEQIEAMEAEYHREQQYLREQRTDRAAEYDRLVDDAVWDDVHGWYEITDRDDAEFGHKLRLSPAPWVDITTIPLRGPNWADVDVDPSPWYDEEHATPDSGNGLMGPPGPQMPVPETIVCSISTTSLTTNSNLTQKAPNLVSITSEEPASHSTVALQLKDQSTKALDQTSQPKSQMSLVGTSTPGLPVEPERRRSASITSILDSYLRTGNFGSEDCRKIMSTAQQVLQKHLNKVRLQEGVTPGSKPLTKKPQDKGKERVPINSESSASSGTPVLKPLSSTSPSPRPPSSGKAPTATQ